MFSAYKINNVHSQLALVNSLCKNDLLWEDFLTSENVLKHPKLILSYRRNLICHFHYLVGRVISSDNFSYYFTFYITFIGGERGLSRLWYCHKIYFLKEFLRLFSRRHWLGPKDPFCYSRNSPLYFAFHQIQTHISLLFYW